MHIYIYICIYIISTYLSISLSFHIYIYDIPIRTFKFLFRLGPHKDFFCLLLSFFWWLDRLDEWEKLCWNLKVLLLFKEIVNFTYNLSLFVRILTLSFFILMLLIKRTIIIMSDFFFTFCLYLVTFIFCNIINCRWTRCFLGYTFDPILCEFQKT